MYDVFISYSRKDTVVIDRIEKELQKYGITMFIDRAGIDAGTDWAETIAQALYDSELVLFVWSENSNTSENTANEIALAIDYQKTIVPFRIGEFKADFKLSYRLIRFNRIDALPYNEGKVVELGTKLAKLLGKTAVATPQSDPTVTAAPVQQEPQDDPKLRQKYESGRQALLDFNIQEAFTDLTQPAINDYRDSRFLLAQIVLSPSRISHVSKESFKPFDKEAAEGNGYALFVMSKCAAELERDHDAHFSYARLSGDVGDSYGLFEMSECYDRGQGVKKDTAMGEVYRQQAIELGNIHATILHARNLLFGWTIKKNPRKGFNILQSLTEKNIPEAFERLGYCYASAIATEYNRDKAEEFFNKAIELGYYESYDSLATLYTFDENNQFRDEASLKKAYDYLMKGAKLNETNCICSLANDYYYGNVVTQDYHQALRWYKKAVEAGDRFSYYMIAYMYYYGNGVEENNAEAWNWVQKGIKATSNNCLYMAGVICQDGNAPAGYKPADSIRFYEESSDLGGYSAEQSLLALYEIYRPNWYDMYQINQYKVYDWAEKSPEKAIAALRRAADYDNVDAKYLLGIILTDTSLEQADEFQGIDLLEEAADSRPLAYIRLAMLSLEGIGKPYSQDYIKDLCEKALAADVEQKYVDLITAKSIKRSLGDAEVNNDNRADFEKIVQTLKSCIDEKMVEAYSLYTDTLHALFFASDDTPEPASHVSTGKPYFVHDSTADMLGVFFSTGVPAAPEPVTGGNSPYATQLFNVANQFAEEGYIPAVLDLGVYYQCGIGVDIDENRAAEYYKLAAEEGSSVASYNLGEIYFKAGNKQEAKIWLRKALELGYDQERVQQYLDQIN